MAERSGYSKHLDVRQVAVLLGVSESTVFRLINTTDIPHLDLTPAGKNGKRRKKRVLRFDSEAVVAWAKTRGNRP